MSDEGLITSTDSNLTTATDKESQDGRVSWGLQEQHSGGDKGTTEPLEDKCSSPSQISQTPGGRNQTSNVKCHRS